METGFPSLSNYSHPINEESFAPLFSEQQEETPESGWIKYGLDASWNIGSKVLSTITWIGSSLIEHDHPWKQERYEHTLSAIQKGHERLNKGISFNVTTPLGAIVLQVIQALECKHFYQSNVSHEQRKDFRLQHYEFLSRLREAILSQEYKGELAKKMENIFYDTSVDVILDLCHVRFTGIHLFDFCKNLVDLMTQREGLDSTTKCCTDMLERDCDSISNAPIELKATPLGVNLGKLKGTFGINFDPHMHTNTPYVLGDIHVGNSESGYRWVRLIRMGTPTFEGYTGGPLIIPEFHEFLQSLQFQKRKYLYISLQNDIPSSFVGTESIRNNVIKSLQEEFPSTFYASVLAQDSLFYYQTESFAEPQISYENFKKTFLSQMFAKSEDLTGFYFPHAWLNDVSFISRVEELMDIVKRTVFKGTEFLKIEDRRDFIEIYYNLLELYLLKYTGAEYANITCKDGIDRAGKNNSLLFKIVMILQNKASSPPHQRALSVITHAPAILVKKQAIIPERRKRLISAMKRLEDEEVQQLLRIENINGQLGINPDTDISIPNSEMCFINEDEQAP